MFSYPLVHGERFNKHTKFKLHVASYMQTHTEMVSKLPTGSRL